MNKGKSTDENMFKVINMGYCDKRLNDTQN